MSLVAEHHRTETVTFSSTYIRSCVDAGDVVAAAEALGRLHRVEGVVVRGDGRGRALGFPTANVSPPTHAAIPADGVYAAWFTVLSHGSAPGPSFPASVTKRPCRSAPTRPSRVEPEPWKRSCSTPTPTSMVNMWRWTSWPVSGPGEVRRDHRSHRCDRR